MGHEEDPECQKEEEAAHSIRQRRNTKTVCCYQKLETSLHTHDILFRVVF